MHSSNFCIRKKRQKYREISSCSSKRAEDAWLASDPRRLSTSELLVGPVAQSLC